MSLGRQRLENLGELHAGGGLELPPERRVRREGGGADELDRRWWGKFGGRTGPGLFRRQREDKLTWPRTPGEKTSIKSGCRMFGDQIIDHQVPELQVLKDSPPSSPGAQWVGWPVILVPKQNSQNPERTADFSCSLEFLGSQRLTSVLLPSLKNQLWFCCVFSTAFLFPTSFISVLAFISHLLFVLPLIRSSSPSFWNWQLKLMPWDALFNVNTSWSSALAASPTSPYAVTSSLTHCFFITVF